MHELDTESRGTPMVTALTIRASRRWQSSTAKSRKPANKLEGIAYMPRAVVTGSGKPPRKRRSTVAPVVTYHMTAKDLAPTNGGNPDA